VIEIETRPEARVTHEPVRVIALRHAMSQDICECQIEPGLSIMEIIGPAAGLAGYLAVTLDGEPLDAEHWHERPAAGSVLTIIPMPHGGSNARSLILTLGLIAAAAWAGPWLAAAFTAGGSTSALLTGASFWQGAAFAVGSLKLNALA
jgi:hypothetical protein